MTAILHRTPASFVDQRDVTGHTAFTLACKAGALKSLEALFRHYRPHWTSSNTHGTVFTSSVAEGRTGLEWACAGGHWATAVMLAMNFVVESLQAPVDAAELERRVDLLRSSLLGHPKIGKTNSQLAHAIAAAQPSTEDALRAVPGAEAALDEADLRLLVAHLTSPQEALGQ